MRSITLRIAFAIALLASAVSGSCFAQAARQIAPDYEAILIPTVPVTQSKIFELPQDQIQAVHKVLEQGQFDYHPDQLTVIYILARRQLSSGDCRR
ncbi:hypothetical protein [Paraburkholderia sp. BCC1886]|uniref:hypothetical protein n=1 Tax=Paraburkholderia sp. BCC1886 TaxID=2562670 RepID=UPI0011841C24|nr:hypothetical protein [Paraburkholderia sp. BCC1886]